MNININTILHGDVLWKLYELEPDSVDFTVTSPPYYKQRNYNVEGQLGQEKKVEDYLQKLYNIFDQVWRITKLHGTLWIVIGDKYNNHGSPNLIPYRLMEGLGKRGWTPKQDIIWWKRNAFCTSYVTMFGIDYEHVLYLAKDEEEYFFQMQYRQYAESTLKEFGEDYKGKNTKDYKAAGAQPASDAKRRIITGKKMPPIGGKKKADGYSGAYSGNTPEFGLGSHMRAVWDIPVKGFKKAHFAVFPEALVQRIFDSAMPNGICKTCGFLRRKQYREKRVNTRPGKNTGTGKSGKPDDPNAAIHNADLSKYRQQILRKDDGFYECNCNDGFNKPVVFDPFMGAGTTGVVAVRNNCNYLGIELNESYIKMANERIKSQ